MTRRPARRRAGSVIGLVAAALMAAACGWGGDIGTGSRADGDGEPEVTGATDDATPPADVTGPVPVAVDRVIDGDSVEVTRAGAPVELRLEGYNAPELYAENRDGSDTRTCNGLAARAAVDDLVDSAGSIEMIERGIDRFGRTLGDLIIDGDSMVDRLIGDGFGLATGEDEVRRTRMVEAASAGRGVWGSDCGQPAGEGLTLGALQVDAPGNDRYNLTEEYVELANTGAEPIALDGWVLRDDTTSHQFPLPGILAAGERLTVITGSAPPGPDRDGVHHLGESFPVWSNEWETVILVDPDGVFADWRFVADGQVLLQ